MKKRIYTPQNLSVVYTLDKGMISYFFQKAGSSFFYHSFNIGIFIKCIEMSAFENIFIN